jgi:predicted flap endonuclease-1-like 5' DNA nuclease
MSYSIDEIESIGPTFTQKLKAVRIRTTGKLLEAAKSSRGRKELAARTGIDGDKILQWANTADRMRIKGIGWDYAELLKAAGVDTVRELKYRNPAHLAKAMAEANARRKQVRLLPSQKSVAKWIAEARSLPLKISY